MQGPVTLHFTGEILGVSCGERPSGMRVGRTDGITTLHVIVPQNMTFAPIFAARIAVIDTKSDGRICVSSPKLGGRTADSVVDEIEQICAAGDRGGIADGDYNGMAIEQSRESWRYVVNCPASSRAALKRIEGASYDRARGVFFVPHGTAALQLVAHADKLAAAAAKKMPIFPAVEGVSVERHDAVLRVGIASEAPPNACTEILAVPTARRIDGGCEVSARYASALVKSLKKMETEAAAWQTAWAAAAIESTPGISVSKCGDLIRLKFDFIEGAGARLREMSPWTRWDANSKIWTLFRPDVARLRAFVDEFKAKNQAYAQACAEWRAAWAAAGIKSTDFVSVSMKDDVVSLEFDFVEGAGARLREISSRTRWDTDWKFWTLFQPDIARLRALIDEFDATLQARAAEILRTEGYKFTMRADDHPKKGEVFEWEGSKYVVYSVSRDWYADASNDYVNSFLCSTLWEKWVVTIRARPVEGDKAEAT